MPRRAAALPFTLRIALANAWVSQLFDQELERRGIEPFQSGTLMLIHRHEPVTPSELHAVMGVPFTTMRNRVNELVRDGLVVKVPNPEDGRSYLLRTTPKAREMVTASLAAARRVERRLARAGLDVGVLTDGLDELYDTARESANGDLSSARGSLTTGPW